MSPLLTLPSLLPGGDLTMLKRSAIGGAESSSACALSSAKPVRLHPQPNLRCATPA